jgi:hypothetical protein
MVVSLIVLRGALLKWGTNEELEVGFVGRAHFRPTASN